LWPRQSLQKTSTHTSLDTVQFDAHHDYICTTPKQRNPKHTSLRHAAVKFSATNACPEQSAAHVRSAGFRITHAAIPGPRSTTSAVWVCTCEPATNDSDYNQQLRPALDQRHSESSFRSARSRKSTRSTDSQQSYRSSKSAQSHRPHYSHHGADRELKSRKKDRDIDARPTMGDSVILVVDHFRDLLSSDRR
jgi:hypothetical protein